MDETIKKVLDWFADENSEVATLWGLQNEVNEPSDKETKEALSKIFNPEQLAFIKILLNNIVSALKFHETFEEAHLDIRDNVKAIDAKLINHRHDHTKYFSAKPEF